MGLEPMAEYLIKMMRQHPGLSRNIILAQLEREYGGNLEEKVTAWETKAVQNGAPAGTTFLETMGRNLAASAPILMRQSL